MFVDGLECGHFTREVFEELRRGDVTCVTPTLGIWETAVETMDAIGRWRDLLDENSDIVSLARSAADIREAAASGRTAVLLGVQNASALDERVRFVGLFHDMGLRVMQLTYNNQNALGGSCYERLDSGLTRFGRQVVREMNQVGMLIDLSHVGARTTLDAIETSERPVAVTHANLIELFAHPRNKASDVARALREHGGIIGLATYRNISGPWAESVERWCEMVIRTVEIAGVETVGIGTDYGWHNSAADLDWMRRGRWSRDLQYGAGSAASPGKQPPPDWFQTPASFPVIAEGLAAKGMAAHEVDAVMGGNWLRVYQDVLG